MSFSIRSVSQFAGLAVLATVAITGSANAGNGLSIQFSVDNGAPAIFNPSGSDQGSYFNYAGFESDLSTYTLGYDINADAEPAVNFLNGNIVIQNIDVVAHTYSITFILPISAIRPGSLLGGSVAGGLTTDFDGGSLSTVGQGPVWSALINGNVVATLLDGPASWGKAGAGSVDIPGESFGDPIPSLPGPAVSGSIAVNLTFTLTAGDQASFTSIFVVESIPAPATLALLGLAGFVGGRRRRA